MRKILIVLLVLSGALFSGCRPKTLTAAEYAEQCFKVEQYGAIVGLFGIASIPGYEGNDFRATGTVVRREDGSIAIITAGPGLFAHVHKQSIYALLRQPSENGNRSTFDGRKIPLRIVSTDKQQKKYGVIILQPEKGYEDYFGQAFEPYYDKLWPSDLLWFFHFSMRPEKTAFEGVAENLRVSTPGPSIPPNVFLIYAKIGLGDIGAPILTSDGKLVGIVIGNDTMYSHWVYVVRVPPEL